MDGNTANRIKGGRARVTVRPDGPRERTSPVPCDSGAQLA